MDLELQQLDLRYEALRRRNPEREARLLASLAAVGQQAPIVVVGTADERVFVVVDGYKRVRGLKRLRLDLVQATRWDLDEAAALILDRLLRACEKDSALEQGWLLRELVERFSLEAEELARRFDRSVSWVSRRLGLVQELSGEVQEGVRRGQLVAHAAMKYLLPLARANQGDCLCLYRAIAPLRLSSRQVGRLYTGYLSGSEQARQLLLADPGLYLRVEAEAKQASSSKLSSPADALLGDLRVLGGVARRADHRLRGGVELSARQRQQANRLLERVQADVEVLAMTWEKESNDARRVDTGDSVQAEEEGVRQPGDCARAGDLPRSGAGHPEQRVCECASAAPRGEGGAT